MNGQNFHQVVRQLFAFFIADAGELIGFGEQRRGFALGLLRGQSGQFDGQRLLTCEQLVRANLRFQLSQLLWRQFRFHRRLCFSIR